MCVCATSSSLNSLTLPFLQDDLERDLNYLPACRKLKEDLKSVENLQIEILKLLLTPSDVISVPPSSKYLFITNFRNFLKENLTESPVSFHPSRGNFLEEQRAILSCRSTAISRASYAISSIVYFKFSNSIGFNMIE